MTVKGEHEIVCQVVGRADQDGPNRGWISVQAWGYTGDRDLVAYMEGEKVAEIGRCLHQLYMEALHPDQVDGEKSMFTREVDGFFLHGLSGEQDVWDLSSADPQHP